MVKRKTERSPLTKPMFHEINRTIKKDVANGIYDAATVADIHGVSVGTVRTIARAGTWPKYQADKEARNERRGRVRKVAVPPVEPAKRSSDSPAVEMKTLTKVEYDDLMELKKDVEDLQQWRDNMYQRDVEAVATGSTLDDALKRVCDLEDSWKTWGAPQVHQPVTLETATPVKRKRSFFRSRG